MRALRFHQARELCVEKVPEPGPPGPGEVLLRPVMCGICGTDLHEYTDGPIVTPASPHPLTGATLPQIMGHEFSAVVAATGAGVSHVRAGDLRHGHAADLLRPLPRVRARPGAPVPHDGLHRAEQRLGRTGRSGHRLGPAGGAGRGGLTPRQAALIEPAAVAAYGVDRGRLQPGQTVLVTGAGPIGSLAAMYALAGGARRVVVSEPDPSRRARAARLGEGLGEVVTADPAAEPVTEIVDELTGGIGADLAVECAGHESALNLCIDAVRPAGTVVQTALHIRPASIRAETLALKDLTLIGTWCYPCRTSRGWSGWWRAAGCPSSGWSARWSRSNPRSPTASSA